MSEQEAHQNGREPWCPPPGAVVRPMLGAVDSPPTVLVRLTRRPEVPDPANIPVCTLVVDARYTLHGWNANYPEFSTSPFGAASLPVPALSPGESIDGAVALDQWMIVDLPWMSYLGNPCALHDWGNMVYYGTSHATARAIFITPPYAQGTPSACTEEIAGPEEDPLNSGG